MDNYTKINLIADRIDCYIKDLSAFVANPIKYIEENEDALNPLNIIALDLGVVKYEYIPSVLKDTDDEVIKNLLDGVVNGINIIIDSYPDDDDPLQALMILGSIRSLLLVLKIIKRK